MPKRLWHYCCDHSLESIKASGVLKPNPHAGYQEGVSVATGFRITALPVIWLTDIDVTNAEDAELIGLGPNTGIVTCNRIEYRFRVSSLAGIWWPTWADAAVEREFITPKYRELLELGRAPQRWWVSELPISSPRLDERYRAPLMTR